MALSATPKTSRRSRELAAAVAELSAQEDPVFYGDLQNRLCWHPETFSRALTVALFNAEIREVRPRFYSVQVPRPPAGMIAVPMVSYMTGVRLALDPTAERVWVDPRMLPVAPGAILVAVVRVGPTDELGVCEGDRLIVTPIIGAPANGHVVLAQYGGRIVLRVVDGGMLVGRRGARKRPIHLEDTNIIARVHGCILRCARTWPDIARDAGL